MPDWITHIIVAWALCTILGFKFKQFNQSNTIIVMVGALIPDIFKISILTGFLGVNTVDYISPIHLPIGSFIIAGIFSLLFNEKRTIFMFLSIGVITHYCLDLLLKNVNGGIYLFYPFYWGQWQFDLVAIDSYRITILSLIIAILVYFTFNYY